ncbi:aminopeptidase P family protein [Pseudomonas sp. FP2300]|uniref:aminopeptidase P family protein n=1 Tax=Pseudomonas sp. FP2300 TaxID=2954090 RepID=UPI002732AB3F|nr:aminopeptidase P family protein [Pseudomonas sp. FP2300]WLH65130.1 aminopeptidase P family protein [Pseudomonas sp. FP2300]
MDRYACVRAVMATHQFDAFLLPRSDIYLNEDLEPADERLLWLTGFSGSVGLAVLTQKSAALLIDGRYTEQARQECGAQLDTLTRSDTSLFNWLREQLHPGATVACDARLHSIDEYTRWQVTATQAGFIWQDTLENPVDECWSDRPAASASPVVAWALEYAGAAVEDKLGQLTDKLRESQCDALWLPSPDMLAWLLNVRGQDIAIAPLPFSFGMLYADGKLDWFIDAARLQLPEGWLPEAVTIRPPQMLNTLIQHLVNVGFRRVLIDRRSCTAAVYRLFESAGCSISDGPNPLLLQRACKQVAELQGSREAHRIDGLALCRFLYEFYHRCERFLGQSELSVVESLERWRNLHSDYRGVSFETIAAAGANAAQPHYLPKPGRAAKLKRGELLLIDSGGQYPQGTTDVTRVLACSSPTARQQFLYTTVLRAQIALATCIFPKGTSGQQLDSVARQVMWREGLDYAHGTGHGVGSYLHVHEGPHRIATHASAVPLQVGMVTSIEPGVYLPGELGIRIENLYEVVEVEKHPGFFGFRILTLAPLANELIERGMLSQVEAQWVDDYQRSVWVALAPDLESEVAGWLLRQVPPNNLQFRIE